MERLNYIARAEGRFAVTGAPEGYDAYIAGEAAKRGKHAVLFIAPDDLRAAATEEVLRFFNPGLSVLSFPAWDCLPYDRVSPKPDIESQRLATLSALALRGPDAEPLIVVTTVSALHQRVPPRASIASASFTTRGGEIVDHDALVAFLSRNGYVRAGTVR